MPPLMNAALERNEPTTGAGALKESGVHTIPPECRDVISAQNAKLEHEDVAPSTRQRRPVRASTNAVCPKMLEAHLPLVHQVVAPIARRVPANVLWEDLLAAGVFGLVDSLRKNGGDGGETFEWYARTRIRGAVLDELRAQDWLTRRARDAVSAASLRDDNEADGAVLVRLDEISVAEEQEFLAVVEPDPAAIYETKQTIQMLVLAIDTLPPRERIVVGMHYLDGARFKEIGAELGVSEPRVSQLHARALGRLKGIFNEKRSNRPMRRAPCAEPMTPDLASDDDWYNPLPMNDQPARVG